MKCCYGRLSPTEGEKEGNFFGDQKTGVKLLGVLLREMGFEPMRSLAQVILLFSTWPCRGAGNKVYCNTLPY